MQQAWVILCLYSLVKSVIGVDDTEQLCSCQSFTFRASGSLPRPSLGFCWNLTLCLLQMLCFESFKVQQGLWCANVITERRLSKKSEEWLLQVCEISCNAILSAVCFKVNKVTKLYPTVLFEHFWKYI